MRRELSSPFTTIWWKFVFPAIWIAGFGTGTVAMWLGALHGRNDLPAPDWMRWLFLIIWPAASAFLILSGRRLHRVHLHGDTLTASNLFREFSAPITIISGILTRPTTITIDLEHDTPLGRRIVFVPVGSNHYLSKHPITVELEAIVGRKRKRRRATV